MFSKTQSRSLNSTLSSHVELPRISKGSLAENDRRSPRQKGKHEKSRRPLTHAELPPGGIPGAE
eukprot:3939349-Rhodomonas_salina.4